MSKFKTKKVIAICVSSGLRLKYIAFMKTECYSTVCVSITKSKQITSNHSVVVGCSC